MIDDVIGIIKKLVRDAGFAANIMKGDKGDDNYRIAVRNGFVGTEAEWLETMKPQSISNAEIQSILNNL